MMKLKWYGTATIQIEHNGTSLLFDPFIPLNNKAYKPDINELSSASNILITHGHFDHISSIPVIMKHCDNKPIVYCTTAPRNALIVKGIEEKQIEEIKPGDTLTFGQFKVRVLKGRHIVFNNLIIINRLLNIRNLIYRKNLSYILKENKICIEAGETVIYDIRVSNKQILLMGSLNLDDETEYPKGADILILPLQGRTDIANYAMTIIDRLQPQKIILDHYDDTFPPLSSDVKTKPFLSLMQRKYPDVPIICTQASSECIDI